MEFYDARFSYIDPGTLRNITSRARTRCRENDTGGRAQAGPSIHRWQKPGGNVRGLQDRNGNDRRHWKVRTCGLGSPAICEGNRKAGIGTSRRTPSKSVVLSLYKPRLHYTIIDLQGVGASEIGMAVFIALCPPPLDAQSCPRQLGSMTMGGTLTKADELANAMQVCHDAGAKRLYPRLERNGSC